MEFDKDLTARQEARAAAKAAKEAQHILAVMSQEQLDAIVESVAKACFADGHFRQHHRVFREGLCHRFHNGIQFLLGKIRQNMLGFLRRGSQCSGLLPGS